VKSALAAAASLLSLALVAPTFAQPAETAGQTEQDKSVVPAWVPRSVIAGFFLGDAITWQGRVQWELTVVDQPRNALVILFEAGGGYGVGLPGNAGPYSSAQVTFFYQHEILAGVAYRAQYESGFNWGFHADLGPLFYGARYRGSSPMLQTENFIVPGVEGYLQAGWRFGRVAYGVRAGLCQALGGEPTSWAIQYVSGFSLGVFADWR
jgi:opacity protein-like surface antigen